jgi:arsenate reductase
MGITFYHNPKCSKSREAMALLEKCGEKFRVVEYLREPLKEAELLLLFEILDGPISAANRLLPRISRFTLSCWSDLS